MIGRVLLWSRPTQSSEWTFKCFSVRLVRLFSFSIRFDVFKTYPFFLFVFVFISSLSQVAVVAIWECRCRSSCCLRLLTACEVRHNAMINVFEKKFTKDHLIHFLFDTHSGLVSVQVAPQGSLKKRKIPCYPFCRGESVFEKIIYKRHTKCDH